MRQTFKRAKLLVAEDSHSNRCTQWTLCLLRRSSMISMKLLDISFVSQIVERAALSSNNPLPLRRRTVFLNNDWSNINGSDSKCLTFSGLSWRAAGSWHACERCKGRFCRRERSSRPNSGHLAAGRATSRLPTMST